MDTLVTTIIASAVAIVAAIIGTVASSRKHDQNLAVHAKESEKDHAAIKETINGSRDTLKEKIVETHNSTNEKVSQVFNTLYGINEHIIIYEAERKARFSNLDDAQKKLYSSAEDIGKFSEEFMRLAADNKLLTEKNISLSRENAELIEQNTKLIEFLEAERMHCNEAQEDYEPEM